MLCLKKSQIMPVYFYFYLKNVILNYHYITLKLRLFKMYYKSFICWKYWIIWYDISLSCNFKNGYTIIDLINYTEVRTFHFCLGNFILLKNGQIGRFFYWILTYFINQTLKKIFFFVHLSTIFQTYF